LYLFLASFSEMSYEKIAKKIEITLVS